MIDYRDDVRPELDQAIELYRASTLGERRPIDDRARFATMLANANLTITAWDGALLVGCHLDWPGVDHDSLLGEGDIVDEQAGNADRNQQNAEDNKRLHRPDSLFFF